MRQLLFFILSALSTLAFAQDDYHSGLVTNLETNYNVANPTFSIGNTEVSIANALYIYGAASKTAQSVADMDFTQSDKIVVNGAGQNQWDVGYALKNTAAINNNDLILMTFWARGLTQDANAYVYIEDAISFDKAVYLQIDLDTEWKQYWFPAKVTQNYPIDQLQIGFHLATQAQEMEIGGISLLNYGSGVALSQVPNNNDITGYEGDDPNAPWRAEANSRIESLRKATLNLTIQNESGSPLEGANVTIEQTRHSFGFGSAIVPSRFPGNRSPNATYIGKLTDLDGNGHGFNTVVTENALKWDGWEEEWIASPEETVSAIQAVTNMGMDVRGHVLLWPGWDLMPDDMNTNKDNIPYLKNRIFQRIDDMLLHPQLKDLVKEWDVINEITFVRDLENHLKGKSGYVTGREFYKEVFDRAKATAPDNVRYINDYAVITQGAKDGLQNQRFKSFLDELFDAEAPIDGIGIQSHIPQTLPSILDVKARLDEYTSRYGVPIKITEYDTDPAIGDNLAGDYIGDFLTMVFSHENVEAFLMWGFWDGNHWKGNAPMFDMQWNLKPAGQRFNELVFGEWWTDEQGSTSSDGTITFRPFKGNHNITVEHEGKSYTTTIDLKSDGEMVITADFTSAIQTISDSEISIYPNPASDRLYIEFPESISSGVLTIFNISGKLVAAARHVLGTTTIPLDLVNGTYLVRIQTDKDIYSDLIQVINE